MVHGILQSTTRIDISVEVYHLYVQQVGYSSAEVDQPLRTAILTKKDASSFGIFGVVLVFWQVLFPFFWYSVGRQGLFILKVSRTDNSMLSRHPWRRCQRSGSCPRLVCIIYSARYASHCRAIGLILSGLRGRGTRVQTRKRVPRLSKARLITARSQVWM